MYNSDENPNIDWDNLEYNDNGTVKFPLKLKFQPKHMGYGLCEKVPEEYTTQTYKPLRTNERCVVCDRSMPDDEGAMPPESTYTSGTTHSGKTTGVFIQPDGKAVCSDCMKEAKQAAAQLERDHNTVGGSIPPEAARKALEAQINKWRWEDLEKEKTRQRSNLEDLEGV